ncbi:MAG: ankyrin repeat domain-containing protein [Gammaproteobacteria bacterium]
MTDTEAPTEGEQRDLCRIMRRISEAMFGDTNYAGCDVNVRTFLGDTPLHSAAIMGDEAAAALLIKAGADIDAKGEDGYTPLHEAVQQDSVQQDRIGVVALLLEHGANVYAKNDDGDDALAFSRLNPAIYDVLAKACSVNFADSDE